MKRSEAFSPAAPLVAAIALVCAVECRSPGRAQTESGVAQQAPLAGQAAPAGSRADGALDLPCATRIRGGQHRGMCYAHNWQFGGRRGYGTDTSHRSLQELAELGVDWVSLTPFGWQESLTSDTVQRIAMRAAETDDRLTRDTERAHALGLRVMMKPHIWISYEAWRGHIEPAGDDGWERWFDSYLEFILHYAELSERVGADALVIGVELVSSTRAHPERWRAIIARVREVYSGPVTYAANWDEAEHVEFWDALDFIGVQMFAPLATGPEPTTESLTEAASGYLERYRALSERFSRPLILTEVGYKSIQGTAVSPFVWPEHLPERGTVVDEQAQAQAYCAIIDTFGQADFVAGIYWWKWFTDPDTEEEGPMGFSPRGKIAEQVLRYALD